MPCGVCFKYVCRCGPFPVELYQTWDEFEFDSEDQRCVEMYDKLRNLSSKKRKGFSQACEVSLFYFIYFISLHLFRVNENAERKAWQKEEPGIQLPIPSRNTNVCRLHVLTNQWNNSYLQWPTNRVQSSINHCRQIARSWRRWKKAPMRDAALCGIDARSKARFVFVFSWSKL